MTFASGKISEPGDGKELSGFQSSTSYSDGARLWDGCIALRGCRSLSLYA